MERIQTDSEWRYEQSIFLIYIREFETEFSDEKPRKQISL